VFDIYVDGSLIANDYDIYKEAGSSNKATILQNNITVTHDNGLIIELVRMKENPAINGIEIFPNFGPVPTSIPTIPPTPAPVPIVEPGHVVARINAGGDDYIDANGTVWTADKFVVNYHGQDFASCPREIANTTDDALYCCHRWFSVWTGFPYVYSIPVGATGVYDVRLHFAEIVRFRYLLFHFFLR
jgi:hypothetical protein